MRGAGGYGQGPPQGGLGGYGQDAAMGQAGQYAASAGQQGKAALSEGMAQVGAYIEKGNDGLAILAFIGNLCVAVASVVGCLNLGDILDPIHYVLNAYLLLFSLVGMVLEAQPEWIEKFEPLRKAQTYIFEFAKFLVELWGRGLFYIFLASLTMCHSSPLYIIMGLVMLAIGGLTIGMHFNPETAKKVVKIGVSGLRDAAGPYSAKYERVEGDPQAPVSAY